MTKVLLISGHNANPHGGASSVFINLEAILRDRGHEVSCLHADDYSSGHPLKTIRKLSAPKSLETQAFDRACDAEVVEVAGNIGWNLFQRLRQLPRRKRPLLVTRLHGLEFLDEQARVCEEIAGQLRLPRKYMAFSRHLANRWEKKSLSSADIVVCHSSRDADAIITRGWKSESHIEIMPLGVSDSFRLPARNYDNNKLRVLWWGSWIERKGIAYLPRTMALASRAADGITLTLGGTGAGEERVLSCFDESIRPSIRVLPHVDQDQYLQVLKEHDVLLFPSLSEGFGLALLESMAAGMPVVTTLTGMAHDWLEHGHNCLIVPKAAPTATARALIRLAHDSNLRRSIGQAAATSTRDLTWDSLGEKTASMYSKRLSEVQSLTQLA